MSEQRRALRVAILFALLGCLVGCGLDLFKPYCDEIGVYPACTRVGGAYLCPTTGQRVCNGGGYEAQYDCADYGGTLCVVR